MAWTPTGNFELTVFGNKRISMGKYVGSSGATGGDIVTGLTVVDRIFLQAHSATAAYPNETFPLRNTSGAVTVVTGSNDTVEFMAIGS